MAENNNQFSVFQGVSDAINGGKKRTPEMAQTAQFQGGTNGVSNATGLLSNGNQVEQIQQQFLDWQVNKISHNLYQRTLYFDTDRIGAYQDFRAMIVIDIEAGEITEQQAFLIEKDLKLGYDRIAQNGDWKTAYYELSQVTVSYPFIQEYLDIALSFIATYIQNNYDS